MTQFEQQLNNLRANLESEKQAYESEKLNELRATELAEFRKEQESVCNEGIAELQRQRDNAVAQKDEEIRRRVKTETEYRFGEAAKRLQEAQAIFLTPQQE